VICLAPAICEELAFRGFILSGLRRTGHKWGAIIVSSLFFGLAHGILQQSLGAAVIGMIIGYIAVKSGSLLPGVLYHAVHNGLSVLLSRLDPQWANSRPVLQVIFEPATEPGQVSYTWPAMIAASLLAAAIFCWFRALPYHRFAEERLQEALDSQSLTAPLHSVA